jgi:hypothetical protein
VAVDLKVLMIFWCNDSLGDVAQRMLSVGPRKTGRRTMSSWKAF